MVPTANLVLATATAMAADTASLDPATALKVWLVAQSFTPGPTTAKTALTVATFTGGGVKSATIAAPVTGRDPLTGREKLIIPEPLGGWTWLCTADPVAPETVYGVVLTDTAGTTTWASALLPNPVTIAAAGDLVSVGELSLLLVAVPFA